MTLDRAGASMMVSRESPPVMCLPSVITVRALMEMQEWSITEGG
jgi:hypothetical protein